MKKDLLKYFSSLCFFFWLLFPGFLAAQEAEKIEDFSVTIRIQENGELHVSERIVYDFGVGKRHGIFREIPKTYVEGEENQKTYKLLLSDFVVESKTAPDAFAREDGDGMYRLKIGDPNQTITGEHEYLISYTAGNAVSFYENFDEVYWSATGNNWDVPISRAQLEIILPEVVSEEALQAACYQGAEGSDEECDQTNVTRATSTNQSVAVFSTKDLSAGEGLTGALGFPKGIVPEILRETADGATLPGWAGMLLVGFAVFNLLIVIVLAFRHWRTYGRDPKGRGVVVTQYDPPEGLSPMETGFLLDERINNHDITAELVWLAEQGFIHILSIPSKFLFFKGSPNFYFLKTREKQEGLKEHQKDILHALFRGKFTLSGEEKKELLEKVQNNADIRASREKILERIQSADAVTPAKDLRQKFYTDVKKVKKILNRTMTERGYFANNPKKITTRYGLIVFAAVFLAVVSSLAVGRFFAGGVFAVWVAISTAIVLVSLVLAAVMVKKTKKGVEAKDHTLGLKQYLSIAEKDRLEFHFDPRKNPELFEKLLPYAIALGVDKQWAKELDDIQIEPDWYTDASTKAFTVAHFSDSFNNFASAAASGYASPSSSGSGGGGFSGGGVGGGGGGSW